MNRRTGRVLSGLAGAAAVIAAITLLSRVLGFGRWLAQSYSVGQTPTGTAYATANVLPNVLFEVLAGGALAGAVIPLLAGPLARRLDGEVSRIASALLTWAVAVLLPASVLLAMLARPVVDLLIPDAATDADAAAAAATAATVDLGAGLLVVFAPQVVLYGIGVVLTGVLQAQRRFVWPAAAPLASSLVVITSYLVFRTLAGTAVESPQTLAPSAVAWLGWGTTAGVAAMSLPLVIPVVRSGVRLRPTLRFPAGVGRRASALALAGIGGLLAQQAAVLVTIWLANTYGGPDGAVNIYQYSQAVYFLPYAVLAVPLATAAFPRLAEYAASGDHARYARLVAGSTRTILLVSAAGTAALVAAAPAVTAVFSQVDASRAPAEIAAMTPTLTALAPGLVGYALIFQVSRVLFAIERGRAAVIGVAAGWTAVLASSWVAVRLLAPDGGDARATLVGLGLGNTIGMSVGGVVLLVGVVRASGRQTLAGSGRTFVVTTLGALGGALAGRWLVEAVGPVENVVAAVGIGVAGAVLAVLVVAAAGWAGDRSTFRAMARRAPGPATGPAFEDTGGDGGPPGPAVVDRPGTDGEGTASVSDPARSTRRPQEDTDD